MNISSDPINISSVIGCMAKAASKRPAIAHKQEYNLKPIKMLSLPCLVGGAAKATPSHQVPKEFPD
jgi:hypothetical protein